MTVTEISAGADRRPRRLVVVNAGVSDPSSTRLLGDRLAQKALDALGGAGVEATIGTIDLASLAVDTARAMISGIKSDGLETAIDAVAASDALILVTPVYKAGVSGILKSFLDILDNDLLIAKPVIVGGTGGSSRHAMVPDEHLRPILAFFRAMPVPTSVYAAPDDWGSAEFGRRVQRAATELALLVSSGAGQLIADSAWAGYQHEFGGKATRAEKSGADVDFGTDLMRLAAGGN